MEEEKIQLAQDDLVPYRLQPRTIGDGELRLDGCLETSGEIYTLCVVAHLKNEDIFRRVNVLQN